MTAIGRVFDGGTGFDAGQVQRADVGDVVGRTAAGIGGERHARRGGRGIEREVERGRRRRVASDVGLPDLDVVHAFDRIEAGAPGMAAIDRVFDGRAGFDARQVQRADIGDVVGRTAARIDRQLDTRRSRRGIEREAERGRIGCVAGDVRLADLHVVHTFDGAETGAPVRAAIHAVLHGGAGFDTGQVQCADFGDMIDGTAARIDRQRDTRRSRRRIEREAERRRRRRIACNVNLPHLHVVHAFDRTEAGAPMRTAIDAVLHGRATLNPGHIQRTDIRDVIDAAAPRIDRQRHARRHSRGRIERETAGRRRRHIAGDIDLPDQHGIRSLDRAETRVPVRAVVGAVLNGRAVCDSADRKRAVRRDVVGGRTARVVRQRDDRGGRRNVDIGGRPAQRAVAQPDRVGEAVLRIAECIEAVRQP
ncbi:hypothetical protein BST28156_03285 [Burkholderia stagnalis]|nr:hypothetical protein BST28156_03285 [Burkholderia stagnalis]